MRTYSTGIRGNSFLPEHALLETPGGQFSKKICIKQICYLHHVGEAARGPRPEPGLRMGRRLFLLDLIAR